jgi:high-affinity K+ transport system ATPase subunit B
MMFWTCDPAVIILTPARVSQVDLLAKNCKAVCNAGHVTPLWKTGTGTEATDDRTATETRA